MRDMGRHLPRRDGHGEPCAAEAFVTWEGAEARPAAGCPVPVPGTVLIGAALPRPTSHEEPVMATTSLPGNVTWRRHGGSRHPQPTIREIRLPGRVCG